MTSQSGGGSATAPPDIAPSSSVLGWVAPPSRWNSLIGTPASGDLRVSRIYVPAGGVASSMSYYVSTVGATLTAGRNLVGLCDASGAVLGISADQSSAWASTTGLYTTGITVLSGKSLTLAGGRFYYGVYVVGGTTAPSFQIIGGIGSALTNFGVSGASRVAMLLTGQTTIPSTLALASLTSDAAYTWMAVS